MFDIDLFAFLDGASPWWWVALALGLGAIEIVTFTYFMLWLGLAAFTVAIGLMMFPDMPGTSQLMAFALLAILYTAIGWFYVHRRQADDAHPSLNRRADAVVGRQGIVIGEFSAGMGTIEIDGIRWRATLPASGIAPAAGATVRVASAQGMTVVVEPAE